MSVASIAVAAAGESAAELRNVDGDSVGPMDSPRNWSTMSAAAATVAGGDDDDDEDDSATAPATCGRRVPGRASRPRCRGPWSLTVRHH